ncbi:MAG: permease prefix domain 1-containing protein [Bacillota bacterium]
MADFQQFLLRLGSVIVDYRYRMEIEEEILDHLECAAAGWEAEGLEPAEARRRAMESFGDPAAIGRLLQETERGGRLMRMVRLSGVCALVSGIIAALSMRETSLTYKIEGFIRQFIPGDRYGNTLFFLCFALFVVGLIGFRLRHARSRSEGIALLAAPVLGPLLLLLGGLWLGWDVMMAGFLTVGVGLSVAGGFLFRREENPLRSLGLLIAIAGALPLLFPFLGPYAAEKPVGAVITYAFATGWMLLGVALLAGRGAGAGTPHRTA